MDRKIESIVHNFENLVPHSFQYKNQQLSGQIVGIDCKDMNDIQSLYLYIKVEKGDKVKTYKVSWFDSKPIVQR
jgi:phage terminase large subunit-like protein